MCTTDDRILVAAFVLMYAVKATGTLRVSKAGELEGLDIHEHGLSAYPEFSTHGGPILTPVGPGGGMHMEAVSQRPMPSPSGLR